MFHRIQNAMSEYLMTISATPDSHLYSYSCCDWAGWFYCNIVACRLVFLTENDRQGHTAVEEVTNVLESVRPAADQRSASTNGSESQCDGTWDPARVARETRVQDQFESFINKMGFTMSSAFGLHGEAQIPIDPKNRDPLYTVVHLQQSILNTFLRRLRGQDTSKGTCCDDVSAAIYETRNKQRNLSHHNGSSYPEINTHSAGSSTGTSATEHPDIAHTRESLRVATMPLFKTVHINAIDFGSIQDTASTPGQQEMYDDWMWDTMMTDFTMPTL